MGKSTLSDQQRLELRKQLVNLLHLEDWPDWIEFQQRSDAPSLAVWRTLIFGTDKNATPNSRGPLSTYMDQAWPGRASRFLHALREEFSYLGGSGFSSSPFSVMRGRWYYRVFPVDSDVPRVRWCEISFNSATHQQILREVGSKNISAATLFDVLIKVWDSNEFPAATRRRARTLACRYLSQLLKETQEIIHKPIPL